MRKLCILSLMIFIILTLVSCNEQDLPLEETVDVNDNGANTTEVENDATQNNLTEQNSPVPYQFMLNGRLYIDTGEVVNGLKCGMMDYSFEKVIPSDQIPVTDGEVNFESDSNGAQGGRRENRLTACVDGQWRIFAYNENNLDGVSMIVKEASPKKLTVVFNNQLRKTFTFGEKYMLEQYDESMIEWIPAEEICEYAAFNEIGFLLHAAEETEHEVSLDWLYGELKTGRYRIVKEVLDTKSSGEYDTYWLMAEFTID